MTIHQWSIRKNILRWMAVVETWEKKEKVAGGEVEPAHSTSKLGESTRSSFKGLSEIGLCCRTARTVHAHLHPLARHGNAPVSIQWPFVPEKKWPRKKHRMHRGEWKIINFLIWMVILFSSGDKHICRKTQCGCDEASAVQKISNAPKKHNEFLLDFLSI